jgi:hypothetical protein
MTILVSTTIKTEANFTLDEAQLRALAAITGYRTDAFLEMFYHNLGKSYLQPHEAGLRSLFEFVNKEVHVALKKVDSAKEKLK